MASGTHLRPPPATSSPRAGRQLCVGPGIHSEEERRGAEGPSALLTADRSVSGPVLFPQMSNINHRVTSILTKSELSCTETSAAGKLREGLEAEMPTQAS